MISMDQGGGGGAPKPNKASKKGKKSWRKNVDMKAVDAALEEARFEERVGGSFADRADDKLFRIEEVPGPEEKRDRKKPRKLRCFANLEGLPGVPDPKPMRNCTKLPEDRENPIVKAMKEKKVASGKLGKKDAERIASRKRQLEEKEASKEERKTRRRTKFDFDIWAEEDDNSNKGQLPSKEWVDSEALIHTAKGKSKHMPKAAAKRDFSTGSLLPAVEVPHAGSSYNPSVEEHQDLLWKATMVELAKEKEFKRIERQTTAMFPSKGKAPTAQDRVKEMSEGILELNEDEGDNDEDKDQAEAAENSETEKGDEDQKVVKPKTRKQKRDRRGRMFEEQKEKRMKEAKIREMEVMRVKSLKKELSKEDQKTHENQERREKQKLEKMSGPIQLSNYKYEPQELELKLSDELTGNLRNLSPEGSLLEDRFKSMQRRNMIEVRVKQKTVRKLKRKKIEKRGHRMGWEENKNVVAKKIRQEAKMRRKKGKKAAK